jgi:SPP1 family predicted phage head-tail adaptor
MAAVDLSRRNFRHRVTIKQVDKTKDDSAGHDEAYTTLLTTWAAIDSRGGSRTFDNGAMVVFERKDFYLTYRSALDVVNEDYLFEHEGKNYKYQAKTFIDERKHIIKYETVGQ